MQQHTPSNWRNLIAACAAITVFGLAFGMTYPLLSLILESRGVSSEMIGINSAMMPIGILLFSSVIPIATKRYGARGVAIAAALATSLLILAYKTFDTLEAWFIVRLLQGMSISTLFVLSEAWIVSFAGSGHRGKIVAIYGSILSASFGAGPALVGWIGIEGWAPFVIGSLVILLGVVPLAFVREEHAAHPEETKASGIFEFAPKAPMLLAAVGAFAIFDAATLSLLPVYGIRTGLDLQTAATALTALIVGNIVLQFPIGWLADRYPRRAVLAGCAFVTALFALLLPAVMSTPWMWPVLVVMGASGYGVYTVSLTSLGDRFDGIELVNGSASFAVMWGIGALLGSVAGGWSMTGFGPHGLPGLIAAIYALLVVGLGIRAAQLSRHAGR
ncbi:MAG: MFS transporter [Gammaproteobacteria bacterium]|nr:MFS transporter [Gammaproteobacteria bacterium]